MNFHFFFYRELAGYLLLGMLDEADGGYTKAKVTTKKHKDVIPACCNELDTSENILTLEDICHDHLGYSSKQILISESRSEGTSKLGNCSTYFLLHIFFRRVKRGME